MERRMFVRGMRVIKKIKILISLLCVVLVLITGCNYPQQAEKNYTLQFCQKLDAGETFLLSNVFDFDFDKAFVISEIYSKQNDLLTLYNLTTVVNIDDITNDINRRILFIKDNTVVYDYVYSINDLFTEYKNVIIYPETNIIPSGYNKKNKNCRIFSLEGKITEGIPKKDNGIVEFSLASQSFNAPLSYMNLIEDYKALVNCRLSDEFESEYINKGNLDYIEKKYLLNDIDALSYHWSCMVTEMASGIDNPSLDMFKYHINDINNDGVLEVFWVRENTILAIFTCVDEKLQLVDAFWSRHKCFWKGDIKLYFASYGGTSAEFKIMQLEKNSIQLISVGYFGYNQDTYYEIINEEKTNIDKNRFDILCSDFCKNTDIEYTY